MHARAQEARWPRRSPLFELGLIFGYGLDWVKLDLSLTHSSLALTFALALARLGTLPCIESLG